ncbi:PREDICTED: uncharacterized protein LOC104759554 [Camelina sativa]|uniref:Uncharacterized protein LOC104759554 n=1 Tax=Camelina sativa TaxID=90675 RepID=A0ABM0X4Y5_CAMSA|nr:PREDICTED: uncharacterized protein LOC104759554 [Camelina sativa]
MASHSSSAIPNGTTATLATNSSLCNDLYENPLYLHSTDHVGLQIVTDCLNTGTEFHSWRRSVRMALNVRNKLGFIDGTITQLSSDHPLYGSWSRCNDMVSTWLMGLVSKKIVQSLLYMPTAAAIWKSIISRFKQDDAPRVFEIEQLLGSLQQGSMDVSAYFTELVTLWEEYTNYIEIHVCTCGRCECNAAVLWERLQQRSKVTKFLMGLNDGFNQTRRYILMLKPIPSIDEVFNMVQQDEWQLNVKPIVKAENVVFQTIGSYDGAMYESGEFSGAYSSYRPRGNRPLCTHCDQMGHTVQKCYRLHGYPPGYKHYNNNNGRNNGGNNSGYRPTNSFAPRGQSFTTPRSTSKPSETNMQRTVANVFDGTPSGQLLYYPPPPVSPMNLDVTKLSQSQVQGLIHQLNQMSAQVAASEPLAPISQSSISISEKGVMAVNSTSGIIVTLPNGIKLPIHHSGNIHLYASLVLYDVLHVHDFHFNLISGFSQDSMIGRGHLMHHLYILDLQSLSSLKIPESSSSEFFCGSLSSDATLWHHRLGHPSSAQVTTWVTT